METLNNFFIGIQSLDNPIKIICNNFDETITGIGKLFTNSYIYNGSIKDGKMNGEGLLVFLNDLVYKSYEGSFIDNNFNGYGKLKYIDGNIFIGNFKDNKKHGSGKIYNSNGDIIIDNIWENDIINGKIIYTENYYNSNKLKIKGIINNGIKIGTWIYYKENETIDYIEYYDIETDKELLLSKLEIDNDEYIKQQKIIVNTNEDLINDKFEYILEKININNIDYYQKFSIPVNKQNNNLYLNIKNKSRYSVIKIYNNKEYDIIKYIFDRKIFISYNNEMDILTKYIYIKSIVSFNKSLLLYHGELNSLNEPHGNGFMYENNILKFSGYFEKGTIKKGLLMNNNNDILYDGTFKFNIPDGEGIMYVDGNKVYEGMITNNKKNGEGISYWSNGQINWQGGWLNNQKHGKGRLYDDTGRLICLCTHEFDQLIFIE